MCSMPGDHRARKFLGIWGREVPRGPWGPVDLVFNLLMSVQGGVEVVGHYFHAFVISPIAQKFGSDEQ